MWPPMIKTYLQQRCALCWKPLDMANHKEWAYWWSFACRMIVPGVPHEESPYIITRYCSKECQNLAGNFLNELQKLQQSAADNCVAHGTALPGRPSFWLDTGNR